MEQTYCFYIIKILIWKQADELAGKFPFFGQQKGAA